MRLRGRGFVAILGLIAGSQALAAAPERPNVVVILADDLGFSDLGCQGSEIKTPNLDALAANGLRFTQFYNTARCWPTRAALLSGYYAQQVRRDTVPGLARGGQGTRPAWSALLPEMLRAGGYRSYHSGKWHVDRTPLAQGFDRSYRLDDHGRFFSPKNHFEGNQKLPAVPRGTDFYTTTHIADRAIAYLDDHARAHAESPFFLYLAFTSPHFPLHARPEDIARYHGRYDAGWEAIRAERWKRVQELGIVQGKLSDVEREVGPPYHFPEALKTLGEGEVNRPLPWSSLTDAQRAFQASKMEIHAAMVDRMDQEIGRVLDRLKASGSFENTLILFLSDNGASAEIMVRDDGHDPAASPGSADSHLCLGPGWSNVANTPFRRHKTWVHEGGISTPLIAHWPRGIASKGALRHDPGHVIDIVPTVLQIAGVTRPETWNGLAVPEPPGKSLVPAFGKDGSVVHDALWWEHEGNKALRKGDFKIVAAKEQPWELFDLKADRTETTNLATTQPDRLQALIKTWEGLRDEIYALASQEPKAAARNESKPVKELILPGESFLVDHRPAFIFWPDESKRSTPQPWVLYGPTLPGYPDRHERDMHQQFLDAGVAVAGVDVGEAYGGPEGRKGFDALYRELTEKRGFAKRPCLLGRSRGGLWVSSWAAANPEKVSGIAGIYPVFDLRTYPGLAKAAPAHGLSADQLGATLAENNPIERVKVLAEKKIPALFIHGDEDKVVPLEPNSAEFARRYGEAGAGDAVTLIVAKGQGHNFWEGFFHCQELIDFAIARAKAGR